MREIFFMVTIKVHDFYDLHKAMSAVARLAETVPDEAVHCLAKAGGTITIEFDRSDAAREWVKETA
jgi:hypothetical protein